MNDTAQNQNAQPAQPVQPPSVQSVPPVIAPHKEQEPVAVPDVLITNSEPEIQLHPEVKEAGVEAVSEELALTPAHAQAGIQMAKESVKPVTEPTGAVLLPMSEPDAEKIAMSKKSPSQSILWYVTEIIRQYRMKGRK